MSPADDDSPTTVSVVLPHSEAVLRRYLRSGLLPGGALGNELSLPTDGLAVTRRVTPADGEVFDFSSIDGEWVARIALLPVNATHTAFSITSSGPRAWLSEWAANRAARATRRSTITEGHEPKRPGRPPRAATGYSAAETEKMAAQAHELRRRGVPWPIIGQRFGVVGRTIQTWAEKWYPNDA